MTEGQLLRLLLGLAVALLVAPGAFPALRRYWPAVRVVIVVIYGGALLIAVALAIRWWVQ